jgi:aerobic-type carbon monoxide dehydrogenase small subunit (CoxS/CutS family)
MSATALIESHDTLGRADIVEWMQTNLCRCGGYLAIVEAIRDAHAARDRRPGRDQP